MATWTWDWQVFCKDTLSGDVAPGCFGQGRDITYLDWMMSAWGWTLSVSLLALLVALLVGSVIGILRTTPSRGLVFFGDAWTELFRNVPLLVQIFLWYHVVPALLPPLKQVPTWTSDLRRSPTASRNSSRNASTAESIDICRNSRDSPNS